MFSTSLSWYTDAVTSLLICCISYCDGIFVTLNVFHLLKLMVLASDVCYSLFHAFRYAGRKNSSIEQFRMALSSDPLCWEAYRELCSLGK